MASVAHRLEFTSTEYLAIERKAELKSELIHGVMYAMSGASREHNLIAVNVAAAVHAHLVGRPCEVYSHNMRVKISDTGAYVYPDVVVACGDVQFEDAEVDTLLNPVLAVEVLSPSTEAFDRGAKFSHYRRLPSLQEYVLIAQDRLSVQRFVRQGDVWVWSEVDEMAGALELSSIACALPLSAVYAKVSFETDAAPAE